ARGAGALVDARGGGAARALHHPRPALREPAALPDARPVSILDRYIVRSILGAVLLVAAVLFTLGALLTFIGEQNDIGSGGYTALGALWFTLLRMPAFAFDLLPITALIGALIGLGTLSRGSEITVMRATGISIVHLAGICMIAGLVLIGA